MAGAYDYGRVRRAQDSLAQGPVQRGDEIGVGRQAAAERDYRGAGDVDDQGKRVGDDVEISCHRFERCGFARVPGPDDGVAVARRMAVQIGIDTLDAACAAERVEAAALAAATLQAGDFPPGSGPLIDDRTMAPFPRHARAATDFATVDDQSTADAGAQDRAEDDVVADPDPGQGFGQGKAIGIVEGLDRSAKRLRNVPDGRTSVEARNIGAGHLAALRIDKRGDREQQRRKATITALTRELVEKGLLGVAGTVRRTGRPSIRLEIAAEAAYFVGVSLVENPVAMVLANMHGTVLAKQEIGWSDDATGIGRLIVRGLPGLMADHPEVAGRMAGIGVALSGLIDPTQRICLRSTLLGWQNVPAAELMEAVIGLPVAIENDAKAVALGEKLFGPVRDAQSFSLISVGDGIGCAHVLDGRLYRGARGGAGEIAHATIEPGGLPCRCGKRGCLDTISSLAAIRSSARAQGLPEDLGELERLAASGNAEATHILHRAGSALGLAISQIIQIIDPGRVIVTHLHGALDGLYGTVVRAAIEANVLPQVAGRIQVDFLRVSSDTWARGAASIAKLKLLSDPRSSKMNAGATPIV
jgi:predicted NBD/HSP70 family sugar kinase